MWGDDCMFRILFASIIFSQLSITPVMADQTSEILFYVRDPWLMAIGSDSPYFAHYADGLTIYFDKDLKSYRYLYLNDKENIELDNKINALRNLKEHYSISFSTDEPTNDLKFSSNGSPHRIFIYGELQWKDNSTESLPADLNNFLKYLITFNESRSKEWHPKYIEVIIWPYKYAPDPSIVWPSKWPDIKSNSTIKRGKSSYSIYLPYDQNEDFKKFLSTKREKGAVLINGKKWTISYRAPFPHDIASNKYLK
jgi:hypothetical protein